MRPQGAVNSGLVRSLAQNYISQPMDATISETLATVYGGRLRLRVCGLVVLNDKILLVRHTGLGPLGYYWSPPGGGLEMGEEMAAALTREVKEETGLTIVCGPLAFVNQYINPPLHAVELFLHTKLVQGEVTLGHDPETISAPILSAVKWFSWPEIMELPREARHHSFQFAGSMSSFLALKGLLPCQYGH